jgi:hypothetical protein
MKNGTLVIISESRMDEVGLIGSEPCRVIKCFPGDYDKETKQHLVRVIHEDTGKVFVARVTTKQIVRDY